MEALDACATWKEVEDVVFAHKSTYQRTLARKDAGEYISAVAASIVWAYSKVPTCISPHQAQSRIHGCLCTLTQGQNILQSGDNGYVYASLAIRLLPEYPELLHCALILVYCNLQLEEFDKARLILDGLPTMCYETCILRAILEMKSNRFPTCQVTEIFQPCLDIVSTSPKLSFWYALYELHYHGPTTKYAAVRKFLEVAITNDYQPVAACNMYAWILTLGHGDYKPHDYKEAGETLARAIAMDFEQHDASVNYALLLGIMNKLPEMQKMLQLTEESMSSSLEKEVKADCLVVRKAAKTSVDHVRLHLVRVSTSNYDYKIAKEVVEKLLKSPTLVESTTPYQISHLIRDRVFVLLELDMHINALEVCEAMLQRQSIQTDPVLLLYKADALICLGRLEECKWTMDQLNNMSVIENIKELHVQVLNNHAIALACHGDIDGAIQQLKECLRLYPTCLHATFNLTLLLWRKNDKVAACVLWLESFSNMAKDSKYEKPKTHVRSRSMGKLDPSQIAAVNRLIQAYWTQESKHQAIKRALEISQHFADITKAKASSKLRTSSHCRLFTWSRMSRQGSLQPLYRHLLATRKLRPDAAQEAVVGRLHKLQQRLTNYELPSPDHGAVRVPRGLYLYGQVGTGKSMLMDLFYENLQSKKRRVHFHAFLLEVHRRIHERKQEHLALYGRSAHIELQPERDIISLIAREIAQESPVLCFDEFQVIDIADAMIMRKFFGTLFNQGTVMVATSNTHPKDLYPDGVNREYFLPFLDLLQQHTKVICIDSTTDHRRHEKALDETYLSPLTPSTHEKIQSIVQSLLPENAKLVPQTTSVMWGRSICVLGYDNLVCLVDFNELCNTDKGAADYKALAEAYRTVVLTNIPQLTIQMHNQARRFITLIDELYENRVRLLCSAAVEPDQLFTFEDAPAPRKVPQAEMDALRKANEAAGAPAFSSWDGPTGAFENDPSNENPVKNMSSLTDLLYACKRAVSRLHEMRTKTYQLRSLEIEK